MYDRALRLMEAGQFERARLSLDTLLNAYPKTALRAAARAAIRTSWVRQGIVDPDPMLLFLEGQTRLTAGKRGAGRVVRCRDAVAALGLYRIFPLLYFRISAILELSEGERKQTPCRPNS